MFWLRFTKIENESNIKIINYTWKFDIESLKRWNSKGIDVFGEQNKIDYIFNSSRTVLGKIGSDHESSSQMFKLW